MSRTQDTARVKGSLHRGMIAPALILRWPSFDSIASMMPLKDAEWLTWTAIGLVIALSFGALMLSAYGIGRHFGWIDRCQKFQMRRVFRIGFGGLLIVATCLPYLVIHVPATTLLLCLFLFSVVIPFVVVDRSDHRSDSGSSPQF